MRRVCYNIIRDKDRAKSSQQEKDGKSMRVNYKGINKDEDYNRLAEIAFDDEDEKETALFNRTAKLMEIKGWSIDRVADGYAQCVVDDYESYKAFMEDWKECKRCIKNCMKFGF